MPKSTITAKSFKPLRDNVLVTDLESGERRTKAGILLADDDMKDYGVRERWARVWAVGPDVKDEISPGEWILVKHGRWTPGMVLDLPEGEVKVWRVDWPDAVLMAAPKRPEI